MKLKQLKLDACGDMRTMLFHHAFVLCEFSCNIVNPGPHLFELMHLYLGTIEIFSARDNEKIGSWSTVAVAAPVPLKSGGDTSIFY